ncbi:hypothetical protein Q8791_11645 [Nocardiopsis sp. CT-R113]|uniref:Uncharacterized protein n=1 Tax=Nocardiopsis codii TaxID=3065942 RepID=A0ABU7K6K3_9ACTN|nr:hypothetical protein [Nocardiopsis sp. CT-R113]MEE2037873.1 hypothetical protein [Nocardiopsis sp. CT-R113]
MNTLLTSSAVLATDVSLDKDTVTPGVMGFLVIFAIGVVLYFLMRSLTGKLRALPGEGGTPETGGPDRSEASAGEAGADEVAASAADGAAEPRG